MPLGAFKAALMGTAGVSTGDVVLLSDQDASTSASITFSSGITSTYGEYIFKWYNIHPGTADANWTFQANAVDASGYNETITSTFFRAYHNEGDGITGLGYVSSDDQANGTAYQRLIEGGGMPTDNDASSAGELHIFNPSSTTYVKHFYARGANFKSSGGEVYKIDSFAAGYFNITAAIDDIQFKFDSGNIDAGTIKMWGVK